MACIYAVVVFFAAQFFAAALVRAIPGELLVRQFIFLALDAVLLIAALYGWLRYYGRSFSSIGLRRPQWTDPLWALSFFSLYIGAFIGLVALIKYFVPELNTSQKQELGFDDVYVGGQLILVGLSVIVFPAIVEELLFRGFIYSSLKKALPLILAALATSLLFAVGHLPEGGASGLLYIAAIDTFVLGLCLVALRELTGSLWASILLHALKNSLAFIILFVLHK